MQSNSIGFIFISLFQVEPSYHGASDISLNFFKLWPSKNKSLIQISKKKNDRNKTISIKKRNNLFGVFYNLLLISFHSKKKLNNYKKKVAIIEGASWAGYSFILICILKLAIKDCKIIYHAHNLEYEVRKFKNSSLIKFLTFYFEKYIYKYSIGTTVSNKDQKFVKKNYRSESILFENGVKEESPKKLKKISLLKNKFILFTGSYTYWPNKIAVENIFKNKAIIKKKLKNIKFVFTGEGFPSHNDKDVINLNIVKKQELVWLIKNCLFFYAPLPKAPGTKIKILEAIFYGSTLVCSNYSLVGIKNLDKLNFVFKIKGENISKLIKYIESKKYKSLLKNNKTFKKHYNFKFKVENFYDKLFNKKYL